MGGIGFYNVYAAISSVVGDFAAGLYLIYQMS